MNKVEIVGYLVNLHNLIEAQMKGQHSVPSAKLADEYNKHWEMLKEEIRKESKDEKGKLHDDKTGTYRPRG